MAGLESHKKEYLKTRFLDLYNFAEETGFDFDNPEYTYFRVPNSRIVCFGKSTGNMLKSGFGMVVDTNFEGRVWIASYGFDGNYNRNKPICKLIAAPGDNLKIRNHVTGTYTPEGLAALEDRNKTPEQRALDRQVRELEDRI